MITPSQNAIILSKIENRENQDQIFDLLQTETISDQTLENLCNLINNLEKEASDQYDAGYQACQEENDYKW